MKKISKIIEEQYQRAIKVLTDNKDKLTTLAERLLEKEVIFKEDLEKIFGKRPFEKDILAQKERDAEDVAREEKAKVEKLKEEEEKAEGKEEKEVN